MDGLQLLRLDKVPVGADAVPEGIRALIEAKVLDLVAIQSQRGEQVHGAGVVAQVEVKDVGRALDEAQVPVGLQGAQLGGAQEAQRAALGQRCVVEDLADGRMALARIAFLAPLGYAFLKQLIEVGHGMVRSFAACPGAFDVSRSTVSAVVSVGAARQRFPCSDYTTCRVRGKRRVAGGACT